jgi:hypothetical protein
MVESQKHHSKTKLHLDYFRQKGFAIDQEASEGTQSIDFIISKICNKPGCQSNILIDYSCMPKKWYANLVDCLSRKNFAKEKVHIFLSYTPKIFNRGQEKKSLAYFGPMLMNRDTLVERKPVSVIAALDHHHSLTMEAIQQVKPRHILAFIPECAHDPEYTQNVLEKNKNLLSRLDNNSIITYDAGRPEDLHSVLTSHCLDQRIHSEVLILPQGPKTFSMVSLLLSVRYPDIKLWDMISDDPAPESHHGDPAAEPVVIKATFLNEDADLD